VESDICSFSVVNILNLTNAHIVNSITTAKGSVGVNCQIETVSSKAGICWWFSGRLSFGI